MDKTKLERDLDSELRSLGKALRAATEPVPGEAARRARLALARLDEESTERTGVSGWISRIFLAPQLAAAMIVILSMTVVTGTSHHENAALWLSSMEALVDAQDDEDDVATFFTDEDLLAPEQTAELDPLLELSDDELTLLDEDGII